MLSEAFSQSNFESNEVTRAEEPRNLSIKFSEIDFDRIMHDEQRSSVDAGFYTSSFQKKITLQATKFKIQIANKCRTVHSVR